MTRFHPIEPLESRIAPAFSAVFPLSSLDGSNGFKISGVLDGDASGGAVSDAGDVNGDGFGDLIIGAYRADPNGIFSGTSYVVFGRANGFSANLNLSTLDGSNGFRVDGLATEDNLGFSVSAAGDVNGDHFDDLIIGVRMRSGGARPGASYVVFGKANGFSATLNPLTLNGSNGFKISGVAASDQAGFSVGAAGDVNGDGFGDLIIGANGADPNGLDFAGASYVIFGKAEGFTPNLNLSALNGTNGFKLSGVASGDSTGSSVSGAGDVNGDGFDDVIIGASEAGGRNGASYVVFGQAGGFAANLNLSALNGLNGFKLTGSSESRRVGQSVSAGDINGDGFADLIVGAPDNFYATGRTYVVFGKASGFAATLDLSTLDGSNGFKLRGVTTLGQFGHSVSNAGDVNGDGFDDVIVGAWLTRNYAGATYVLFGGAGVFAADFDVSLLNGSNGFALPGVAAGDNLGSSVSAAGDVNGDGFSDLIIGASGADPNGSYSGASYVVFGRGPELTISDGSVSEGDNGTTALQFTISLSEAGMSPVVVAVATNDGTAVMGTDYLASQTQLTFAPGERSKMISVSVTGDTLYELDETFTVSIVSENAVVRRETAIGTILNDDAPPAVSIAGGSVLEGDGGTSGLVFTVSLSTASGLPVNVGFASAEGTALAASDYAALAGTINFAPGETSKEIRVEVLGDTSIEDHETLSVSLSNPSGATIGNGTAIGTILNDDTAIRISDSGSGLETDAGVTPFVFIVSLEKPSARPVTVNYQTVDGSGIAGSDFNASAPGTQISFAPGEITKTITIDIFGDTSVEAHETFSVVLSDPMNAAIVEDTGTATILNDDALLQISGGSVLEGHTGSRTISFAVSLTAPSALPVSVNFASADGTATADMDYAALTAGTLNFAPAETSKSIAVEVLGDLTAEPSETFSVLLSGALNAVMENATATGRILDDDVVLTGQREATFSDVDGELVTIKVSKGRFKVEDFTIVPSGSGAELALVDLSGKTEFAGAALNISAKHARGATAGDDLVNVGYINASGVDLGKVRLKGDLGRIDAGDGDGEKPAVKSLSVATFGARGVSTQIDPATATLQSEIAGDVRTLKVSSNIATDVTIAVDGRLGSGTVNGNVEGATLTALGVINPAKGAAALAIGSLRIGGNITGSQILAGYDRTGAATNADASIGPVLIAGDWVASNLVAGAVAGADKLFGTEDDALISGSSSMIARIASVVIKGTATGTEGGVDHFGFVAEEIAAFKMNQATLPLTSGPRNDLAGAAVGSTDDLSVREVV